MPAQRLSLPGWIIAATIPVFVVTWILAPRETVSGAVAPNATVLPRREQLNSSPLCRLCQQSTGRVTKEIRTIYGLEQTWRVAFTFDDGPHPLHTKQLLAVLERHRVTAAFFINGYWLEGHTRASENSRAALKAAHHAGHLVGNHTYHHALLSRLSPAQQSAEIRANHDLIRDVTGTPPQLFRPPYAAMTHSARLLLQEYGYSEALWSATAPDLELRDPGKIHDTVMTWLHAYSGGIVMLHDLYPWTVQAVDRILTTLRRENCRRLTRGQPTFRVVSLDSFLRPPPESGGLQAEAEEREQLNQLRLLCAGEH